MNNKGAFQVFTNLHNTAASNYEIFLYKNEKL